MKHFTFLWLLFSFFANGQELVYCLDFDENIEEIQNLDLGIGDWVIGEPNKSEFDSSYSYINSLNTNLTQLNPHSEESSFTLRTPDNYYFQEYLGLYGEIVLSFKHRFDMDDTSFGLIEVYDTNTENWDTLMHSSCNFLYTSVDHNSAHINLQTTDTINYFDCFELKGNSNGWWQTRISIWMNEIFNWESENVIFRFSYFSSGNQNQNGWQIDDICLEYDFLINVDGIQQQPSISIHPNPTNNRLNLELPASLKGKKYSLVLYDALGRKVWEAENRQLDYSIDISNFPNGLYHVQLSMENIGIAHSKLVISK